jgi:DNA-nicking Smr family endonuclease
VATKKSEGGGDFASEMGDVRRLRDRDKTVGSMAATRKPAAAPAQSASFDFPDSEDPRTGTAKGIQARHLKRLKAGAIRPEREVDLHGLKRSGARSRLRAALVDAHAAGERCVLVIHGKGSRSEEAPVLRSALPEWLAELPCGPWILAFCPARPSDGGAGASYVLLRRARPIESG